MTSFLGDFAEGFAQLLTAAGLGLSYADTYTAGQTGIGLMKFPLELDNAVALAPYPLTDSPALNSSEIGLQIKTRMAGEDPRAVWALDDAIANFLLGNYPLTLPTGVRIVTLQRTSSGSLGQDDAKRWNWTSNYPCSVYRPSLHRV